jgi:L-alanine-DL-glutamate epimerase-like enolase superfamily enzyme
MNILSRRKFIGSTIVAAGAYSAMGLSGCVSSEGNPAKKSANRKNPLDGIERENIRITDVKCILLSYELKPEEQWVDTDANMIVWKTNAVIIKISTDKGIFGLGASSHYSGPEEMKKYTEEVIKPVLTGKNPFDVEFLTCGLSGPRGRNAWAAADCALWDIIGKVKNMPVYRMLAIDNKPETHLRVYASDGEFTWLKPSRFDGPESLIKNALHFKEQGYTAFKYRPGGGFKPLGIRMKQYIEYVYKLREAVGWDFDLMQEANERWSLEQALEICPVLEELKFLWFEAPTKGIENYLKVKAALPTVNVAAGEAMKTRLELIEWVDRGALDIVQHGADDAGITEAWYMARVAQVRGRKFCPHNWQDGMVTITNAHLMAAAPNRLILESNMTYNPLKEGLFKEPLVVKNGYLDVPDKPGFGVELRDDIEKEFPYIPGYFLRPNPEMPQDQALRK